MSSGSPRISERMTASTFAGQHSWANRPPLTALSRFRMVLISTISAPQASSCPVIFCSSSPETSGFSNRALPPPESRNSTVSFSVRSATRSSAACVPRNEFSSGTGCPASKQEKFAMGPITWSYLVTTTPFSIRPPRQSEAALAICQAALPAATSSTLPGNSICCSARCTAASGCTAAIASRTI